MGVDWGDSCSSSSDSEHGKKQKEGELAVLRSGLGGAVCGDDGGGDDALRSDLGAGDSSITLDPTVLVEGNSAWEPRRLRSLRFIMGNHCTRLMLHGLQRLK